MSTSAGKELRGLKLPNENVVLVNWPVRHDLSIVDWAVELQTNQPTCSISIGVDKAGLGGSVGCAPDL